MRKIDYVTLARLIREVLAETPNPDPVLVAFELLAYDFAKQASVNRVEFLLNCGVKL
jgi:hypothetical protein